MGEILDSARGRVDDDKELRARLATAPEAYLTGAVDNPLLGEPEMLVLLRNRRAPAPLLVRIARTPRWNRSAEIRRALAKHPRMPRPVARTLLLHLFWRDLADVADDRLVAPALRRDAETLIRIRFSELTVGERIALARRAGCGLMAALIESGEDRVLEALLGNPRTTEREALKIASSPDTPARVLDRLATHPVWSVRPAVRIALVENPRTRVPTALGLVEKLPAAELNRLSREDGAPRIVRVGAGRRLARAFPGRATTELR